MYQRGEEMIDEELVAEVQGTFQSILYVLGETFSRELLRAEVAYRRVKPLKVESVILPVGITGCCVALKDSDMIFVRTGLDPLRTLTTELHECAHLLLNHVPACTVTYAEFLQSPDLQYVVYRDRSTAYNTAREKVAEMLGRLITKRVTEHEDMKRQNSVPPVVLDLWGDRV